MFNTSSSIKHISAALVAASHSMSSIKPDARNPHFNSEYISLSAMTEQAKAALKEHHVTVLYSTSMSSETNWDGSQDGGRKSIPYITVYTTALHDSGEFITVATPIVLGKLDPQGTGGAIAYGRRYGLASLLAIVPDEDDDGNVASGLSHRPAAAPPRPPATTGPAGYSPRTGTPMTKTGGGVMPFGRDKGKPLAECTDKEIQGALDWAVKNGKFVEFQAEAAAIIADRASGSPSRSGTVKRVNEDEIDLPPSQDGDDDLPF